MKVYKKLYWIILTLLLTGLLASCGFHLRGQNVLPPTFHAIKIDSGNPYGDFESVLRRMLSSLGVCVTRTGNAPIKLHILSTTFYHDAPTIGGSNEARVYVYYYQVTFELLGPNCNKIIPPKCLVNSRTLIVNAGYTLDSTSQLDILQHEMQIEAVNMIINMITAPALRH